MWYKITLIYYLSIPAIVIQYGYILMTVMNAICKCFMNSSNYQYEDKLYRPTLHASYKFKSI